MLAEKYKMSFNDGVFNIEMEQNCKIYKVSHITIIWSNYLHCTINNDNDIHQFGLQWTSENLNPPKSQRYKTVKHSNIKKPILSK